ncbi:S-adenosylmethionine synthetase N-terminal domain-containing protein [Staphylococcus capitis]|nr:hypothetical protein [Staphylococcus capitis]
MADEVSDGIVEEILKEEGNGGVGCERRVRSGMGVICGEI